MTTTTDVRSHLALPLDVDDLDAALDLARLLAPWYGVAKVGLELWAAAGPAALAALRAEGFDVFCDLKLHDIPTTVGRAARVLGRRGARYVTLHAAGGEAMLRAGVEGLAEGAESSGPVPIALGVTVLTSDADASAFDARLGNAVAAGCGGVVCAASELDAVRARHPRLVTVVPGIRFADGDAHDQARVATPRDAIARGGDLLVVGRAVTAAPDPQAAARRVAEEVAAGLATAGR